MWDEVYSSFHAMIQSEYVTHQVGVLTDQVEAQGEKIRDLESSLEEHRQKLASTEEMLQQVTNMYTHMNNMGTVPHVCYKTSQAA